MGTKNVKAYGTEASDAPLKPLNIHRREVTAKDVEIEILYCGVCPPRETTGAEPSILQSPGMKLWEK